MLDAAVVIGKIPDGSGYDRQSSVVCVRMVLQIFFRIFFKGSVSLYHMINGKNIPLFLECQIRTKSDDGIRSESVLQGRI